MKNSPFSPGCFKILHDTPPPLYTEIASWQNNNFFLPLGKAVNDFITDFITDLDQSLKDYTLIQKLPAYGTQMTALLLGKSVKYQAGGKSLMRLAQVLDTILMPKRLCLS